MADKNIPPENSKTVQVDPKDKGYEAEPVSSINAGKNAASKQTRDESARKANDYTPEGESIVRQDIDNPNLHYGTHEKVMPQYHSQETGGGNFSGSGDISSLQNGSGNGAGNKQGQGSAGAQGSDLSGANGANGPQNLGDEAARSSLGDVDANSGLQDGNGPISNGPLNAGIQSANDVSGSSGGSGGPQDLYDVSEITDDNIEANAVNENAGAGTVVGITALATDADAADTVSYSLTDDAGGLFTIDANTGVVTTTGPLDAETATSHTIEVTATSTDGSTSTANFNIGVNDLNEAAISAISDTDGSANSVAESATIGTAVGVTAFATDADVTDTVTYSLTNNPGGLFAIDANTGVITVAGGLDAETSLSHTVEVTATSTDGSTSTADFTIDVTDVNEAAISAISDTDGTTNAVDENAGAGTVVGITALATDADATDTVSYSLTDDAGGLFTIDANTGVVTTTGPLDAETALSHTIEVTATSTDGSTSTANFNIGVNDLNEAAISAISDTDGSANSVAESATIGTAVGVTAFATDADVTDTVTYSLTNNPGGLFAIDANTGVITVAGGLDAETSLSHTVEVTATSTDGSTSTADFTIDVTDVNEAAISAISDTDGTTNAVDENAGAGTVVGITALATDADATDTVSYSLTDDAGGLFTIDANTGVVTTTGPLDAETALSHTIEVTATSTDGSTSTANFNIGVNDLNEAAISAISDTDGSANSVAESATIGTAVGVTAFATDADVTDTVTYSLTNNPGGLFAIDANTGVITVAGGLDAETSLSHTVEVTATSTDGSTSTADFTIDVTDVNEAAISAISDTDGTTNAVDENAGAGTVVGITALATDADATDTVSYSLTDDAGGLFTIDANTGVVTTTGPLDAETALSHTIEVTATSTDGSTSTGDFTIAVNDLNEAAISAISDTDGSANSVAESATIGTAVGVTALATDADVGDTVSYSLSSNPGGLFAIDANTGVVTVAGGLDAESALSHTIEVTATSTDGSTSTADFTIDVTDVNEAAISGLSDSDGTANTVDENAGAGTVVGITALATDADASDSVTYSLSDDAGGLFTIDANTGVVTTTGSLDAESATSHSIEVTATSTDGSTSTGTFNIAVNDLNEASISAISDTDGSANSVAESATIGTAVGVTAFATDADVTDTVTYSLTNNPGGLFAIDANTGVITVAGGLDAESALSHTIEVTATSTDGSTSTADFTINVTDVDEANVGAISDTDGTANAVLENASVGTSVGITAFATDADVTDTVSYSLSNDAGGLFTIDSNTGEITVNGDLTTLNGVDPTIQVTATSTDGSTSTADFTIDLNAAPTDITDNQGNLIVNGSFEESEVTGVENWDYFSSINGWQSDGDIELHENGMNGTPTTVAVDGDQWFEMDSDNQVDNIYQDVQTVAGQNYQLSMDVAQRSDSYGTDTIEVYWNGTLVDTVDPSSTTWETSTFNVEGTGGMDRLEFRELSGESDTHGGLIDNVQLQATLLEDASNGTVAATVTSVVDPDSGDTHTFSLTDDAGGAFTIDTNTGVITVADNSLLDFEAAQTMNVTVQATDQDGLSYSEVVTINIGDVSEAGISSVSDNDGTANAVDENAAGGTVVGVTALATDPDVIDTVTYSLSDDAGGLFQIDVNTGVVTTTGPLDAETATSHVIEVTATSTDGSTSTANFTIGVNDLSETSISAISDTDGTTNEVSEGASIGTAVGVTAFATDADVTDTVTYSLSNNPGGLFAIDANTGVVTVAGGLDAETALSHTIEVTATSTDGSTSTADFTIDVTDVNEAAISGISDSDGTANGVNESATVGTSVGITALATDADATDTVSYSLTDDAGGLFTIDANTGEVTVAGDLTTLNGVDPTVEVTATSTDGSTSVQDFTIDLNAAPTDIVTNQGNLIVNGNFEAETVSGAWDYNPSLTGWSTDSGNIELRDHNAAFGLNGTDGDNVLEVDAGGETNNVYQDVQTTAGQNYQLSLDLAQRPDGLGTDTIEVYWNGTLVDSVVPGSTNWETFTFNVEGTGGMDRLEFREPSGESDMYGAMMDNVQLQSAVLEDASNGTVAATVTSVVDPDSGDTHTFSLTDDAGGAFTIDTNTGVITVADNSLLDFEAAQTMNVTVQATDQDGLSYSEVVTINVGNSNEAPTDLTFTGNSSLEYANTNDGALGITSNEYAWVHNVNGFDTGDMSFEMSFAATDAGHDQTLVNYYTFAGSGGDSGSFVITAKTDGTVDVQMDHWTFNFGSNLNLLDGNQHTVSVTYDDSTKAVSFYVDGTFVDSATETLMGGTISLGWLTFGQNVDAYGSPTDYSLGLNGDIFEARLWNDVRTSQEISDNWDTEFSNPSGESGLVSNWQFNDGTGDDVVGTNDLNLVNGASVETVNSESVASGTVVLDVTSVIDADSGDTHTYSLVDDADGKFSIDANTGEVTLNAQHTGQYTDTVTVRVTDSAGNTYDEVVGINIGTNGDDTFTGTANTDVIYGLDGESNINGGDGDDFISVGTPTATTSGTMTSSTTYTAINLGNYADVDTYEFNGYTENVTDLLGTYGGSGNPLHAQTETAVANDTDGNGNIDDNDNYHVAETITFDGVDKTIDSTQVFNATVTFTDGSSGTFTAVVSQFEGGDVYLMPEYMTGPDADLLTSKPIMSVSLDSVSVDDTDLVASRLDMDYTIEGGTNTVDGGAGNDVIYGSTGNDVIDGGDGNDTIYGSPTTQASIIANETFEGGATGWTNNATESSAQLTEFLGRTADTGHSGVDNAKTFTLDAAKSGAVIEFDMHRIDSWDGEEFKVFIDGQEIAAENFNWSSDYTANETDTITIGDTTYTTTFVADGDRSDHSFAGWDEQTIKIRIEIDNPGDTIELGFGSTINQGVSDESYGIDNVKIVSTDDLNVDMDAVISATDAGDTLSGGAGNDTIYGGSGDDIITGGTGDDTLNGGDGSDLFIFREGDGTDTINGGAGTDWTDTLELQAADGSEVGAGWTYNVTSGSVTNSGADFMELSDDADGFVTLNDGSQVNFEDIERIEW